MRSARPNSLTLDFPTLPSDIQSALPLTIVNLSAGFTAMAPSTFSGRSVPVPFFVPQRAQTAISGPAAHVGKTTFPNDSADHLARLAKLLQCLPVNGQFDHFKA